MTESLYERRRIQLRWLLVCCLLLLVAGMCLPMLTITQFIFIRNEFSVISGVYELWQADQYALFLLISSFSIMLPFVKLALIFRLLHHDDQPLPVKLKWLKLMHDYGRWAMLDVMVVAMLVVSVKLGAIASIHIHPGLYVFAAAVLLIMFTTHASVRLLESADSSSTGVSHPCRNRTDGS